LRRKPQRPNSQKSTKITGPIGIRIMPHNATKSNSFIVTSGNTAVIVATRPV